MKKLTIFLLFLINCAHYTYTPQTMISNNALISWNKNSEADMSKYVIFTDSRVKIAEVAHPDTSVEIPIEPLTVFYYDTLRFYAVAVDFSGNVSNPSNTAEGFFSKYNILYGDVNGSLKVDVEDRAIVLSMLGIYVTPTATDVIKKCDLNGDHKIDIIDIAIIDKNLGNK